MEWIMNWWWATVLGPIVLGAAIVYALFRKRRLTARERTAQREGTERQYRASE
jgi:cytochrome c-type biogenesis protein CcmH/NrfF